MRLLKLCAYSSIGIALLPLSTLADGVPFGLVKTYYSSNSSWLYGWSMAPIGTNKLLVGSLQDTAAGSAAGAAYIMDAVSGAVLSTIPNPTPAEYDFFGCAVSPVGANFLIGAMWDSRVPGSGETPPGAAYVFDGTSGSLLRTFKAPSTGGYAYGSAVATVGGNILIGQESEESTRAVTAYLYDGTTGNLVRTFSNIGERSGFTSANSYLAVAGTNVLVGTPGSNSGTGRASLINTNNGGVLRTFSNPFVTTQDNFGFSVAALPGNRFAIAAPWADRGATNAGAVYIFNGANGSLLRTLLNPNPSEGDNFGMSIAAVGNNLLVGAPHDDFGAVNAGLGYLFSIDTGSLLHTFHNPTPQDSDWFGRSVSGIDGDFLIGGVEDNTVRSQAGAVYRFAGVPIPEPSTMVSVFIAASAIAGMNGRRRVRLTITRITQINSSGRARL
jgi:hypothetical protein